MNITCVCCGNAKTKQDPFYYEWQGRRHRIRRCTTCTHQFVWPQITDAQQEEIYGDEYFSAEGDWACSFFGGVSYEEAEFHLREEAREVLGLIPRRTGTLLDVGCAGGVFLDVARSAGLEVMGIEINERQAESASTRHNLQVLNCRIEDAPENLGPFDIVTLMDVLEHLPHPASALEKISGWMRPGGILFIRGPLSNSPSARLKETVRRILRLTKRLPGYPLDANMFNRRSLAASLKGPGFRLERLDASRDFANVVAVREGGVVVQGMSGQTAAQPPVAGAA